MVKSVGTGTEVYVEVPPTTSVLVRAWRGKRTMLTTRDIDLLIVKRNKIKTRNCTF